MRFPDLLRALSEIVQSLKSDEKSETVCINNNIEHFDFVLTTTLMEKILSSIN